MRFITEFIRPENVYLSAKSRYVPEKRHLGEVKLGNIIAESFGWQNPVNHDLDRHRLEIEAFPMEKWIEFKQKLFSMFVDDDYENAGIVLQLIKDLESFGKPSGDAITN